MASTSNCSTRHTSLGVGLPVADTGSSVVQPSLQRERRPELGEKIQRPDATFRGQLAPLLALAADEPPGVDVVATHDCREGSEARLTALRREYRAQIRRPGANAPRSGRDVAAVKSIDQPSHTSGQFVCVDCV